MRHSARYKGDSRVRAELDAIIAGAGVIAGGGAIASIPAGFIMEW